MKMKTLIRDFKRKLADKERLQSIFGNATAANNENDVQEDEQERCAAAQIDCHYYSPAA